jgi:hypothetical protein
MKDRLENGFGRGLRRGEGSGLGAVLPYLKTPPRLRAATTIWERTMKIKQPEMKRPTGVSQVVMERRAE